MREDMAAQIDEWRRLDVLSEIDDSIRAIYELLTGNCGKCEGKLGDGRENKAADFQITSRFGLDWRRAFGLRLWYGTLTDEPIHMAVAQFADDLREGRELVKPVPWFVEHNVNMGWDDPAPETREDLLWGLLKLYAAQRLQVPANVEDILAPQNTSGNPLNARLSFQLLHLLRAREADDDDERRVHLPTARSSSTALSSFTSSMSSAAASPPSGTADPLAALADALTLTYASTLHTPQHWPTALYAYTHLSTVGARSHHARALLALFAPAFDTAPTDPLFRALTTDLSVPLPWLHAAKALQARARGDRAGECAHLLEAGDVAAAHDVLCRAVAPAAVVARDYDALRELLGGFENPAGSRVDGGGGGGSGDMDVDIAISDAASVGTSGTGHGGSGGRAASEVEGWAAGGGIYFDFMRLLDLENGGADADAGNSAAVRREMAVLVKRLGRALASVAREGLEGRGLEERVALGEIAGVVAKVEGGWERDVSFPCCFFLSFFFSSPFPCFCGGCGGCWVRRGLLTFL